MDNNIQFVKEVSKIQVKTYGYMVGTRKPQVSIFWNGAWQQWKIVNIPGNPYPYPISIGWATNTWNLEDDQKDVDDLRVRYKAKVRGTYPMYQFGANVLNAFYCNITYEPGISIMSPK